MCFSPQKNSRPIQFKMSRMLNMIDLFFSYFLSIFFLASEGSTFRYREIYLREISLMFFCNVFFFCHSSRNGAYIESKSEIPPREAGDGHEEPDTVHSDSQAGQYQLTNQGKESKGSLASSLVDSKPV